MSNEINSSFRDPSGHIAYEGGKLVRYVSPIYREQYNWLMASGLYGELTSKNLLVRHKETRDGVLEPEIIPFISYPHEWCFSAYKAAALATLEIQELALEYNMVLKDASSYNIQFKNGYPVLIDTLSFDEYKEGNTWGAYCQFCRHFLAPLSLMSMVDSRLGKMMAMFIEGIPLDLASRILPKMKFNFGIITHIHGQAMAQKKMHKPSKRSMSKMALCGLIRSLKNTVNSLGLRQKDGWARYTKNTSYNDFDADFKMNTVIEYLRRVRPETVWDMGANDGSYSILASEYASTIVAFDRDLPCVELCYQNHRDKILPLVLDITNPSPSIGWANKERMSLAGRGSAEMIMALALVHHLAIGNNTPLNMIAEWFHSLGEWLIVEFVAKDDPQVKVMLTGRVDIFDKYTQEDFELIFGMYYEQMDRKDIPQSCRSIYLYRAK